MSILQLDPPIPLETEKGKGLALFLIDYGIEHSLIWVVALNDNRQFWCVPNEKVRAAKNWTMGRSNNDPF